MQTNSKWICLTFILFLSEMVSRANCRGDGGQQNKWPNPQQGWNAGGSHTKGGGGGNPIGGWDDEVSNPWGGFPEDTSRWKLEDSIPGMPGKSYPNLDKIPDTSFDCRMQKNPGYYGDIESQCQVFHICQAGGRQNSFLCPVGTIFNQETFVCDWWFNVNCVDSSSHYDRNSNLFRGADIGIDGSKITRSPAGGSSKGSEQLPPVGLPTWDQGSQGMKGNMNQNRQKGPWQNSKGQANNQKGARMANGGGNIKGPQASPRMGSGKGMNSLPVGAGRPNNRPNQKGARDNNSKRQNGWNQPGIMNQKGRNHPQRGNQHLGSNQKGDNTGNNRSFKRKMMMMQNQKGDSRGSQMTPGNFGDRRMKGSSGPSKGSNANNWSMNSHQLLNQNTDVGDMWGSRHNLPTLSHQMNSIWSDENSNAIQNNGHFKGESANNNPNQNQLDNNWNMNHNKQENSQLNQGQTLENVNNVKENNNWNYDYSYNENSWLHNKQQLNEYQSREGDYDYNS